MRTKRSLPPSLGSHVSCPNRPKLPRPPALVVVPLTTHHFGVVTLGQFQDVTFHLTNGGEADLTIANVVMGLNPNNEFAIVAAPASGQTIPQHGAALAVTVRFTPTQPPLRQATLRIQSDDPADGVAGGWRTVAMDGSAQYPVPTVAFLLPNGAVSTHVQVGLWDNAWNPANGALFNGPAENDHFVGRDSRSFWIRVIDMEAASRAAPTVSINWWTLREDNSNMGAEENDDHPAICSLTLHRVGATPEYRSKRVMLVTDADDAGQATHDGMAGLVNAGQADHRLRRITVAARYELDHSVRASYAHAAGVGPNPVVENARVFGPAERRRLHVHFFNVRAAAAGGALRTTHPELNTYEEALQAIYARAGIFVQVHRAGGAINAAIDPPVECTNWANRVDGGLDPAVAVAIQERSQNPIQIMPHPTQTALINAAAAAVPVGHIRLFFVADIHTLWLQDNAGGEAFYAAQATPPGAPVAPAVLQGMNQQLRAMNLAEYLYRDSVATPNATWRGKLTQYLGEAMVAAQAEPEDNILAQAQAFWASVNARQTNPEKPIYGQRLQTLQNEAQAAQSLYNAPAVPALMTAAQGCAFVAPRALIGSDLAPAHEVTHITTNLNNEADGHYDLENPAAAGVGYDLPGFIDGKNLMHRYSLDAGGPVGVNLPKRLWDAPAMNNHRVVPMAIPAQISAILANATFIHPY